jgi:hypothetical protein
VIVHRTDGTCPTRWGELFPLDMDGAAWLQSFVEVYRTDVVRVLDVPHVAEYMTARPDAPYAGGMTVPARMLERRFHVLKHHSPDTLVPMTGRFPGLQAVSRRRSVPLGSVRTRLRQMQSPIDRRSLALRCSRVPVHRWPKYYEGFPLNIREKRRGIMRKTAHNANDLDMVLAMTTT